MRPLIGIAAHQALVGEGDIQAYHHVVNRAYVKAVRKAGGVPVALPVSDPDDAAALLERVDGLLMTGGGDVDPASYSTEPDPRTTGVNAERDAHDIALCRLAVEREMPTLAICRGSQILNVALGGTLIQHVDDHFDVDRYNEIVHQVKIGSDSGLAEWVGETEIGVNTLHHQSVDRPGDDARVVAYAPDGTVEAIEVGSSRRIIGVQWHPELVRHRPEHLALFSKLVRLAGES